ncbi:hypothetical protein AMATHDRAFT_9469 [Amanita thiersii Skay4041]|uniref:Extracellular metalloproteinase n=1 Tax=Amanita thiersii Skay4041 TaxID=703135 RepID=A0A2A9NC79_9AGAR|nr:hypothetical protein AMATHDRAFT_9469 [Amanita thiersii Skay4041]
MVVFSKTLASQIALFAFLFSGTTEAAPWPAHSKHATHRLRTFGKRGTQVESYFPKSTFKTFGIDGFDDPDSSASSSPGFADSTASGKQTWSLNEASMKFVRSQLSLNSTNLGWKSGYSHKLAKFAYIKQTHDGIPFANAVANVAYNKDNKVISFGSSFVDTKTIAPSTPSLTWASVVPQVEESLGATYNNHTPSLEYFVQSDGSVALTHVLQFQNKEEGTWVQAFVCAHSGKVVSVTDFVAHASYKALPIQDEVFTDGVQLLKDPENLSSSPFGWHSDGTDNTTNTFGNNVAAFKGTSSQNLKFTDESADGLTFDFTYDDSNDPTDPTNLNAARVNGFFVINTMHDIAYKYGFTEEAFNFQFNNFGKGGQDNDGVLLSVQDASGTNNANFATPPDGQSGVCRMFIWDLTTPRRDGAMENDIVVHEMTHGITNRLTGGGTGQCLQTTEAAGMGEGWSDAMAEWVQQDSAEVKDFVMGQYVTNKPQGIRSFPYSTDPKVNPLRFSDVGKLNEVHNIGEVWANMLHNVYAALVQERGFSADFRTNPDTEEGNVVFMRLFMDSLALQPCNPTFVSARDAWIQADANRFNGANKCTLFKAFASRGLGLNAKEDFVDDTTVPAGC